MPQTVGSVLQAARQRLARHGIAEPRAAAEVLLAHVLAQPRSTLYLEANRSLRASEYATYMAYLARRLQGEPVQYITGHQEFWSLEFCVNAQVLIPRPETELLVEHGVQWLQSCREAAPQAPLQVLDVGTGSGNVAISLAHAVPYSHVWGVDIAPASLDVARRNAQRLGVGDRLTWVCGDLVTCLRAERPRFALCVSNLPYVTTAEWERLPREIRDYEPTRALWGGSDGLDLVRRLVVTSPEVLMPGGLLLLEVGWQQAAAVAEFIREQKRFCEVGTYPDFAGIERSVWARIP